MKSRILHIIICLLASVHLNAQDIPWPKLTGTPIGSISVDYDKGTESTTINAPANAFDGDYNTFYASYARSNTWVGLDLGKKFVIHAVAWAPRASWATRVKLAVFEGANKADFSDAIPLYIIPEDGTYNKMTTAEVNCTRGFRYVRYVSPNNVRCNVAELAFYGEESEGSDEHLAQLTNLPTLVVNTENCKEIDSKEIYRVAHVSLISKDGAKILETDSTLVRGRGNGSWTFPKKPFVMKFQEKHRMPNSPAKDKKWTVINNYGDKTLMRNMLAFEMSRIMGLEYTPYCQPVDVIVNGEYRGNYQLSDHIEVGDNRVDIIKTDSVSGESGYLLEIDAYAYDSPVYFYSNRSVPVTVHYPDEDDITTEQKSFINNYWNKFETALYSSNYSSQLTGYRQYFDVESLARYVIVEELAGNTDAFWSTYIYKNPGEKMFVGPIWDVDLGFDNDGRTYPVNNLSGYIYATNGSIASTSTRQMVNRIISTDAQGKSTVKREWTNARLLKGLTYEHFSNMIDSLSTLLDASQKLNFVRWPIMNEYVHQNPAIWGSYEAEVEHVRSYIKDRFDWMDNYIGFDSQILSSIDNPWADYCFCYPEQGGIRLAVEIEAPVGIYTIEGKKVMTCSNPGTFISLPNGLYIIKMNNKSRKIKI